MDILNKMKVPELKSVLREYKKVHYQPYSKLNREGLIKLIVRHKLHENDLSKHIKVKVITNKKTQPKKDEKKPESPNAKAKKPTLRLIISQCKTILRHSPSRGFKAAKTTYAPSNFYSIRVLDDTYKENFGYTKYAVHIPYVEFEGIPSDAQIVGYIIGRHLFSSVHIDGNEFHHGGDNQCGRETEFNTIFKGKWNGKGENPTKTHTIDLQKYDSKPKAGEEHIVLKKPGLNKSQPVRRGFTKDEIKQKELQKREMEEDRRMAEFQATLKNVRRR